MAKSSVSQSDFFYGWSLLFKTIEKTVNKKADIVIALTHFVFTKHSSFRCVGIGDSKVLEEDEHGSELLPDDYNEDDTKYALRYVYNGVLYILLGHITEGSLVINLLNVKDKSVSNICVEPCELVVKTKGSLEEMIPTASAFADRLRKEILDPVFGGNTREDGTQTTCTTSTSRDQQPDPLRIGEPRRPMGQFSPEGLESRPFGFPDVGRGDLDPLGRGGPGNLFEFPRRPDMRGGPQPRFDPFGPPERNLRPNPNPDHFQPPGFGGDHYL